MSLWNELKERDHIKRLMEQLQQLCPGWKSVGTILTYFELYKTMPKATQKLVSIYRETRRGEVEEQPACYQ
ncbi:MAG: hypothetical protein H3Z52_11915 [archaeon]|nr:hypothetical protein [archaeon]MCP8321626.1 hypothetical protein [archaeon]